VALNNKCIKTKLILKTTQEKGANGNEATKRNNVLLKAANKD